MIGIADHFVDDGGGGLSRLPPRIAVEVVSKSTQLLVSGRDMTMIDERYSVGQE